MEICIWCKYGNEEAKKIEKNTPIATMDCRVCPKCKKECVSGTFMVEE